MRILLLHPEDHPLSPVWASQRWDRVIDLGFAGPEAYERWSRDFGCSLESLPRLDISDLRQVRNSLFSASGRMQDSQGLDWWDLVALRFHEQLECIVSLQKLTFSFSASDELVFSRPSFQAQVMERLRGCKALSFSPGRSSWRKFRRLLSAPGKFGFTQMLQIAGDKYDPGYRLRRLFARRVKQGSKPVVLLPSAYVNVSRTALGYAALLPERDFLLVITRKSGWVANSPGNVHVENLASYAPGQFRRHEFEILLNSWGELHKDLIREPSLAILNQTGLMGSVPRLLREGLAIRDAWLRVFDLEPISSVLCADDSNPYTRIPLLIASARNLPTVGCHHGALDGRHRMKRCHADTILAKGEMEHDYLIGTCHLPRDRVEIGAPPRPASSRVRTAGRNSIIFFSEPYELSGGRCLELYREVLPKLTDVAMANGCRFVIKLHPYESRRERVGFVRSVLSGEQQAGVSVVDGSLSEELFRDAWFAVTVLSTAALDCALRQVPVFLCRWLDHSNYGYVEQFAKFAVGMSLDSADCFFKIPQQLENWSPADVKQLWEPMSPLSLNRLLATSQPSTLAAAV